MQRFPKIVLAASVFLNMMASVAQASPGTGQVAENDFVSYYLHTRNYDVARPHVAPDRSVQDFWTGQIKRTEPDQKRIGVSHGLLGSNATGSPFYLKPVFSVPTTRTLQDSWTGQFK